MKKISLILALILTSTVFSQDPIEFTAGNNNTTVNTCNGFISDPGGQSAGYGTGDNVTITICPDTIGSGNNDDLISVLFSVFNLDNFDDNPAPPPGNVNVDYMTVYNGFTTSAGLLGVYSGTDLQGVLIQATNLNPSGCLTFVFTSNSQNNAGMWSFSGTASCSSPCDPPIAGAEIIGGATVDSILACVGDPVSFIENGSFAQPLFNIANYEWDFGDGITAAGSAGGAITHTFTEGGMFRVEMVITDDNPDNVCKNSNLTNLRVFVGTIPSFENMATDTSLCMGEAIDLVSDPLLYGVEWIDFPTPTVTEEPCMTDDLGVLVTNTMTNNTFGPTLITNVSDIVSICVEMEHSFMGDFVLQVQCPTGGIINLHQQGGSGTNLGTPVTGGDIDCDDPTTIGVAEMYCFTSAATETWVEWVAGPGTGGLPAGDYEPVDDFSGLIGCPLDGTWSLLFTDNWLGDDGSISSWSINYATELYPEIVSFTPVVGVNSDSSSWDMSGMFITNPTANANEITITPANAGVFPYTFSVTDNFGCTNDSTITITVYDSEIADVLDDNVCPNVPYQLTAETEVCEYTVNMTDTYGDGWNGGYLQVTTTIGSVDITLSAGNSVGVATYIVPTGSVYSIQWFNGGYLSEVGFVINAPDGTIVLQEVADGPDPSIALNNYNSSCPGNETFAGLPNYTYSWTSAANLNDPNILDPIASISATETFTLTMYPNGHPDCVLTDNVTLSLITLLNPGTDSTIILCLEGVEKDFFQYLGVLAEVGGQWYNTLGQGITMPVKPDTLLNGLYEYRVGAAGCISSAFIDLTVTQIDVSAIVNHSDCQAFNGEVQLVGINTLGPIEYSNDFGTTYVLTDLFTQGWDGTAAVNMGSGNSYNFTIRDSVGCVASLDSIVNDDNFPLINTITSVDSDCGLDNGQVTATTANGGTVVYTYSIQELASPFIVLPIVDLVPNTYHLILEDNFLCRDTVAFTINSINLPVITSTPQIDNICNTGTDGEIEVNGNFLNFYSIDGGINVQTSNTFPGLSAGNYTITAYSSDPATTTACQDVSSTISITEPNPLDVSALGPFDAPGVLPVLTSCPNNQVVLSVSNHGGMGTSVLTWVDGLGNVLGNGNVLTFSPSITTVVTVGVTEGSCPPDSETMTVKMPIPIAPFLTSDIVSGCYPIEVEFTNQSSRPLEIQSTHWQFSPNTSADVNGSTNTVSTTYSEVGVYDVTMTVTSIYGCVYDTTFLQHIETYDYPHANYTYAPIPPTIYETEVSFTDLSSDDVVQWAWTLSGASPANANTENVDVAYPEGIPAYYPFMLEVWNDHCKDSILGQVQVINDVNCFAPNVFTPDGDGFNETWRVFISGIDVYDYHLRLFNRWGEVVWESYDSEAEWNGAYNSSSKILDGSYVWVIHAKDSFNDKKYEFRGTVSIVR